MTCRYRLPSDTTDLDSALVTALTAVVKDQPLLRVGILKEDTNEPTFSHIPKIDLRNHIEYRDAEAKTQDGFDTEVANLAAGLHDQVFADVATLPPWKVTVLKPKEGVFTEHCIDILFAFHHTLMDGTGGKEFHQHLVAALQNAAQTDAPTELEFPDEPELPEPEEDVVGFKNSYSFLASAVWKLVQPNFLKSSKPGAWSGKPISLKYPHVTRALPIDFPPEILTSLVKGAREHSTTLTGLLQALIFTSFSTRLSAEDAKWFQSTTPINLRPFMLPSANQDLKTKLRTAVTSITTDYSPNTVSDLRENPSDELIWSSARRVKEQLVKRLSEIPNDDVMGLIPLISDMFDYFRKKEGEERDGLWELSNIGVLKQDKVEEGWRVTRFMFTGSPMVAGAAVGFNSASVEGLTITATWQEGIVDGELVEGVKEDLLKWTKRWHEEGKFL